MAIGCTRRRHVDPPEIIDGHEEFIVEAIINHRIKKLRSGNREEHKVAFAGYGPHYNKWLALITFLRKRGFTITENPHYREAERYANEGLKILRSHIDKWGVDYPRYLEAELRDILKTSTKTLE